MTDTCPQCHHEWHRISEHPVYTFEPPGPDDPPYGRATAVKVHIPGGMECLKTQLDQAKARIAELEDACKGVLGGLHIVNMPQLNDGVADNETLIPIMIRTLQAVVGAALAAKENAHD